ncbi:DUF4832 domain-containing protein [Mobilitalea sibirica]|uniref:DUF4832 domain-containing protein n=1 Tax=Mobilitalea sibirica TaxID=1462919 RepID=A0A8J7H3C3_9FIRM|nr:DUF4832 domain-containing protein [Mobilitalea sibirica]MBH1941522.1 DUF4832 domain-containing protein [Mobilitalea sibirica]
MSTAKKIIIALVIVLFIFGLMYMILYAKKIKLLFTESQEALTNPARGFYIQFDSSRISKLETLRKEGITLALMGYDIKDYVREPISLEKLEELRQALETAKEYGIKVIFRAAYGFEAEYEYKDPKDIEITLGHIRQIAPIVNEYRSNILCVQAGFLGPWGEWHHSNLLPEEEQQSKKNRNTILGELIKNLDNNIVINVRRPRFIRDALEAGLDTQRLGFHNDALLSTDSDMGTYDDPKYSRTQELEWVSKNMSHHMNGGEMPKVSVFSSATNATAEFEKLNLTYLNSRYNKEVLESWKKETLNGRNAFDDINNRLGYRYSLKSVTLPKDLKIKKQFDVKITVKNTGFSAIKEEYVTWLIIENNGIVAKFQCDKEQIHLIKGMSEDTLKITANVPQIFEGKNLNIGIKISGPADADTKNYYDSVHLANEDIEYKNGVNYIATYIHEDNRYVLKKLR